VEVSPPNTAEQFTLNQPSPQGFWPSIFEKAFAKLQAQKNTVGLTEERYNIPPELLIGDGGYPADAIALLTGHRADENAPALYPSAELAKDLENALQQRTAMVASKQHHAYSILAFDPKGPDGGTLTIRDPRGELFGDKNRNGRFESSLKSFKSDYSRLTMEILPGKEPVTFHRYPTTQD